MSEQGAGPADAQAADGQGQSEQDSGTQQAQTEMTEQTQQLDPEGLQAELRRARQEAARYRTQSRDSTQQVEQLQAQLNAISQALGLETPETDPSQELERLNGDLRTARLENAFHRVAADAGADVNLTWAYLYANRALDGVDPNGDPAEVRQAVRAQVDAALQANPKLRADSAPARSSIDPQQQQQNGQNPRGDMNALIRAGVRRG